jgi:hypothetical protein
VCLTDVSLITNGKTKGLTKYFRRNKEMQGKNEAMGFTSSLTGGEERGNGAKMPVANQKMAGRRRPAECRKTYL